jgi:hypothetical protein
MEHFASNILNSETICSGKVNNFLSTYTCESLFSVMNYVKADPVATWSEVQALIARTVDRGFESRLRHGCLSSSFYVVLFCVGRGLATS